jgi:pseudouridine-5'-phosphate glycosidase
VKQVRPQMEAMIVSEEVQKALGDQRGVVALESTMLVHGLPKDRRMEVAALLAAEVQKSGAMQAVIAIMDGRVRVGLSPDELRQLCHAPDVRKCGRRDVASALALGGLHGTTVSATLWAAAHAGIEVFATGAIGGVHLGFEETLDESQDLMALAAHPVAVISAGAKAILDLPRTLERLETMGVPVVGWRCAEFPAFYHRSSGLLLDCVVQRMEDLCTLVHWHCKRLRLGGVLVCNPVPFGVELDRTLVDNALCRALQEAREQHVAGKALTPFLLSAMERLTSGRSVETNIALARHNACVGGELARALATRGA